MAEEAEKALDILMTNVDELTAEISATEEGMSNGSVTAEDVKTRVVVFSERITLDQIAADGVAISKSAAADALAVKDRKLAQKLSVLLARRKRLIKTLNALGERVEALGSH